MHVISILVVVVFFGSYWAFIRWALRHKNVLAKPEQEQRKLKKQLYLGLIIAIVVFLTTQFTIQTKSVSWINWLVLAAYLGLWIIGGYMLWQAYRVGIKKDAKLIKKQNGQRFNHPEKFKYYFAFIQFFAGISLCLLGVAIPVFKLKMASWAPLLAVIGAIKHLMTWWVERQDAINV